MLITTKPTTLHQIIFKFTLNSEVIFISSIRADNIFHGNKWVKDITLEDNSYWTISRALDSCRALVPFIEDTIIIIIEAMITFWTKPGMVQLP